MKLLIALLNPPVFIGVVFMLVVFSFLFVYLWRRRTPIVYLLFLFLSTCALFIIANEAFHMIHMRLDSVEDYIPQALCVAEGLRSGPFAFICDNYYVKIFSTPFFPYTIPLGVVFAFSQDSIVAGNFISSIFGALTIYMLYHITKDLFGKQTALLAALMLAISPFFIFISSVIMRDTMVVFLIAWFYRLWLLHDKTPTRKIEILMVVSLLIMGILRPAIMAVVVGTAMMYKIYFDKQHSKHYIAKFIRSMTIVVGIITVLLLITGTVDLKSLKDNRLTSGLKYTSLEGINDKIGNNLDAGSRYYPVPKFNSLSDIVTHIPLLVAYFMASPFPWDPLVRMQSFALLDSLGLWVIYLLFFLQIRSFWRENRKWAIILFAYLFLGILAASVVQTNVGGSQRHRIMFTTLMLPFAAHQIWLWLPIKKRKKVAAGRGKLVLAPGSVLSWNNGRTTAL